MCLAFFGNPLSLKKHSHKSLHHVNELESLPGHFGDNNVKLAKLNVTTLLTSWRSMPLSFATLQKSEWNKSSVHFSVAKNDQNAQKKCNELHILPMPHNSGIGLCECDEAMRHSPHVGLCLPTHLDTHHVFFTFMMTVSGV